MRADTGIQISVGVGPSRLVAKCCSDLGKPAGFVAMGREEACIRFAPAPTRRLPGIGPKTAERLARWGYATVAQLQEADEALLAARFGDRWARYLKARASFLDDSPVETETGAAKSVSTERTFDEDIASHAELETVLRGLSRELCEGLAKQGPPRADGGDQGAAGGLDDGDAGADAGGRHERRGAGDVDRRGVAARVRAAAAGAAARRAAGRVRRSGAGSAAGAGRAGGAAGACRFEAAFNGGHRGGGSESSAVRETSASATRGECRVTYAESEY